MIWMNRKRQQRMNRPWLSTKDYGLSIFVLFGSDRYLPRDPRPRFPDDDGTGTAGPKRDEASEHRRRSTDGPKLRGLYERPKNGPNQKKPPKTQLYL